MSVFFVLDNVFLSDVTLCYGELASIHKLIFINEKYPQIYSLLSPLAYCNISDVFLGENFLPWFVAICLIYYSIGKPRVSPLRFLNPSAVIQYLICVYASHFFAGRPYHFNQTLRTANKF